MQAAPYRLLVIRLCEKQLSFSLCLICSPIAIACGVANRRKASSRSGSTRCCADRRPRPTVPSVGLRSRAEQEERTEGRERERDHSDNSRSGLLRTVQSHCTIMFQHAHAPPAAYASAAHSHVHSRSHSARSSRFAATGAGSGSFTAASSSSHGGAPITPYDNLSRSALQGTYLQPFRLVTPHDAIQRPTASARAAVPPLLSATVAQSNERSRARERKRAKAERAARQQHRLRQQEAQAAYAAKYNLRALHSASAHERNMTWEEQLHQSSSTHSSYGFTHSGGPQQQQPQASARAASNSYATARSAYPQPPQSAVAFDPALYYGAMQQPSSRPFTSPAGQVFPPASYAASMQQQHFPPPPASPSASQQQSQQQQQRHKFSVTAPLSSQHVEHQEEEKQQTTQTKDDAAQQQLSQSAASMAEQHHRRASTSSRHSRHSQSQSVAQQSATQTQQQQQQAASQPQQNQQLVPATQPASAASNYSNPFSADFDGDDANSNSSASSSQQQQQTQSHARSQSSRSSKVRRSASSEPSAPAAAPFVASPSVARFVPYLGSTAGEPRRTADAMAPMRNPATEYVVSRNAAQRMLSASSAAVDHAMVVSPRALPLPTPPPAAAATADAAASARASGSQLYTLRKLRAADVIQQLHFPVAPSPAEVSRSIGRGGIVTREASAVAGGGTDRKRSIGIASSSLQEKHLLAQHHGPVPLPPSAAVQAAAAAHRARIENLALTAFPQPTPQPQRTMFDSPALDPRRASGAGIEGMSLAAAQSGSASAADAAADADATPPPALGFKPAQDGDVLDLYFFLTDPACPIFRSAVDSAGAAGATNGAASSATSSMLRAMMQQQQQHRDLAAGLSDDDGSGQPRTAAAVAASALAAKYSIDLLSLAGLVEAAGGSVRTALGYLQQIVPKGAAASSSSAATASAATATGGSNLPVPFDPFTSMSELIHTVRLMRERDLLASVPAPLYRPPGRGEGPEAIKAAEAARATRWLYASNRRVAEQPEDAAGFSFLQPAPSASSSAAVRPMPLVWGAKDPVLEARDRERAARIAAQQYLQFEIEAGPPPRRTDAPVEA